MTPTQKIAVVVASAIKAVTIPLLERLARLEAQVTAAPSQYELLLEPIRERLATVEDRQMTPGPEGPMGARGLDGAPGDLGPMGPDGARGMAGDPGPMGPCGPQGEPGPCGPMGPMGPQGERGDPGLTGPRGPQGTTGIGLNGRDGLPGVQGPAGEKGRDGLDGVHGKDGVVTLEGLDLSIVRRSDRTIEVLAGGRPIVGGLQTFDVVLYRGVWVAGHPYETGDSVTWAGSQWIAREATTAKPGDGATGWQLAVKAGRDGKEGKGGPGGPAGPKGDKGDPGRNYT